MNAVSLMVVGTMSNSGKSFVTAGLARVFYKDGLKTAPFKSQNMALNSYVTKDGLEMGRAQVMQAEACDTEPDVRMNPILLKPTSDMGSQVIVNGEVYGTMGAVEYYKHKKDMIPHIMKAYDSLRDEYDMIVLEGAGSPAEINLKDVDIVNMGMAEMSDSPVILVADIDRGGVFASIYGTIMLLDENERRRIKGIIINKFRGDVSLLKSGIEKIEELVGVPVLGVIPYADIDLDDEDSLSDKLCHRSRRENALVDIAVVRLPRISNFTDMDSVSRIEGVSVRYVSDVSELGEPDVIILPGTKNTMSDLRHIRQNGLEAAIIRKHNEGCIIFGICGGYQMLGRSLSDPLNAEDGGDMRGMCLLDTYTEFSLQKHRTRVKGTVQKNDTFLSGMSGKEVSGYEIHMGKTYGENDAVPFVKLSDGTTAGYFSKSGNVFGTYLHGFFDGEGTAEMFIRSVMNKKGIDGNNIAYDDRSYKKAQYDKLEKLMRDNLDIGKIYDIVNTWSDKI